MADLPELPLSEVTQTSAMPPMDEVTAAANEASVIATAKAQLEECTADLGSYLPECYSDYCDVHPEGVFDEDVTIGRGSILIEDASGYHVGSQYSLAGSCSELEHIQNMQAAERAEEQARQEACGVEGVNSRSVECCLYDQDHANSSAVWQVAVELYCENKYGD